LDCGIYYQNKMTNEKTKKYADWKEWIPLYGIGQAMADLADKKPSMLDNNVKLSLFLTYQYIIIPASFAMIDVAGGLLEKLVR
jgi:hypothetical protein